MSGAFKSGVRGGLMGFIMSALSNYYLLPMPSTLTGIAIGNGNRVIVSADHTEAEAPGVADRGRYGEGGESWRSVGGQMKGCAHPHKTRN